MEYYVFDTKAEAIAAEADISTIGGVPITGNNAATNEAAPSKQATIRWAVPQQRITDNKWVFQRVTAELIASADPVAVDNFRNNHTYVLENYDSSWFPDPEML